MQFASSDPSTNKVRPGIPQTASTSVFDATPGSLHLPL
jgi:hypothetical protein